MLSSDRDQLRQYVNDFFPRWDLGRSAIFWQQIGLVLLWNEVPWHPPDTDQKQEQYQLALDVFERAATRDPTMDLPTCELA